MSANEIKSAALRLFARKGYDATPLSEIANEVGIKTPSLYAHFKSKDDLFLAVLTEVLEDNIRQVKALIVSLEPLSVEEKLSKIVHDSCKNYMLEEEKITFLKRAMLFPPVLLQKELQNRFIESEKLLSDQLRTIFVQGMKEGVIIERSPDDYLASYYCLMDGTFVQMYYYGAEYFENRLQSIWAIYWSGISTTKS